MRIGLWSVCGVCAVTLTGCIEYVAMAGIQTAMHAVSDRELRNAAGTKRGSTVLGSVTTPSQTAASATEDLSKANWENYQPSGVPLKVELPGAPQLRVNDYAWDSTTLKSTIARVVVGSHSFGVSHGEFSAQYVATKGSQWILDQRRRIVLQDAKASLRSDTPWSFGTAIGRELISVVQDGKVVSTTRIVMYRNWLIQANYLGPLGSENSPDVQRFFSSFQPGE